MKYYEIFVIYSLYEVMSAFNFSYSEVTLITSKSDINLVMINTGILHKCSRIKITGNNLKILFSVVTFVFTKYY